MMMHTTIVSWFIEGDETSATIPPAIILNKAPNEITLGDIKRYYHGPVGVFMFKTLEEEGETILLPHDQQEDERYHWTVVTEDEQTVPVCGAGGIIIKVRPNPKASSPDDFFQLTEAPVEMSKEAGKMKKPFLYEDLQLTDWETPSSSSSSPQVSSPSKKVKLEPNAIFQCTYQGCDKTFNKPWRLKSHLRNHTGEKKPHVCTYQDCGKSFNESQALKNHLRVHTGEKPYVCHAQGCDKSFSEKGNLRKHMRIHTGEKPYVCTFEGCDKSYGRSDQLKVHIYEHTGIKPFACEVEGCGKTFSYSSGLKVHQRVHCQ